MDQLGFFSKAIRTWRRSITISVIVAFIIVMLGESQGANAPTRVTIAYPSPSPRVAPLWVAQDLDLFGKYGLQPQVVLVRNNQMLSAGLISGDLEVGYTGGTTVLGAAAAGVELKMVGGFISRGRGFLTVKPEIRKTADLAGKRFGVQSIGGTIWMYAMLTLEQLGLDLARDKIQLLVVGDQTVMVRALETGIVDAAVMTTRAYALALKQKGFNVLAEVFPAMSSTGIVARRSFIERNQTTMENVIKALIEAEYFILSPRGRSQTVKTIINRLKLSDPNLAEEGYADIVKEFDAKPYPSLEGLKNMQRLMAMQNPKLADINTASLIDSSFIRKLDDSGYFTQMQTRYRE
jgi:NitT/TauT family transport system substrate-binding protein